MTSCSDIVRCTDQNLYRTRPFTEFWVVSIEHLRRVWHADRGRLLLWTPGPVPLGLAYGILVETNPFPNLSLFYRTMLFEYPLVLSRFCIVSIFSAYVNVSVRKTFWTPWSTRSYWKTYFIGPKSFLSDWEEIEEYSIGVFLH